MPNHKRPAKPFPTGNNLHKSRNTIGRKRLFATPQDLWQAAHSYFDYCVDNPLPWWEPKRGKLVKIYKMQPMSLVGLCMHIGISHLRYYRQLADFTETVDRIIAVIYVHNYTAAVVGLLNGRMIGQSLRQCANTKNR